MHNPRLLLPALILLLFANIATATDWYHVAWTGRTDLTVESDHVDGSGTLTDFAFCVDLSDFGAGHDLWSLARTDGGDIRATAADGTTEIPCYVEPGTFSTSSKTGILWINEDLSSGTDTLTYVYYGNPAATTPAKDSTYGEDATFSKYGNVWTMSGASYTAVLDSTVQGIDMASETGSPLYEETGKIGHAIEYNTTDGSDKHDTDAIGATYYETDKFFFSCWAKITLTTGNKTIFALQYSGSDGFTIHFLGDDLRYQLDIGGMKSPYYTLNASADTWYHITGYYNGSNYYLYTDGVQRVSGAATGNIAMATNSYLGSDHGSSWRMHGHVDQIMVSKHADCATAEWGTTLNTNQAEMGGTPTFYVIGTHEDGGAGGTLSPAIIWQ